MSKTHTIIVAAGTGSRFGSDVPKQFLRLSGLPVVMHAINRFRQVLPEGRITLVISREMEEFWENLCREHRFESPDTVWGGATRWESVSNALRHVADDDTTVLVHDGARPLVDAATILRTVSAATAEGAEGAIPVTAVTDSLRVLEDAGEAGRSVPVDRSTFRAVQTPQAFPARVIKRAYALPYRAAFTDDASVVEAARPRCRLRLVEGSPTNIKITNPADLAIAETLMRLESR